MESGICGASLIVQRRMTTRTSSASITTGCRLESLESASLQHLHLVEDLLTLRASMGASEWSPWDSPKFRKRAEDERHNLMSTNYLLAKPKLQSPSFLKISHCRGTRIGALGLSHSLR